MQRARETEELCGGGTRDSTEQHRGLENCTACNDFEAAASVRSLHPKQRRSNTIGISRFSLFLQVSFSVDFGAQNFAMCTGAQVDAHPHRSVYDECGRTLFSEAPPPCEELLGGFRDSALSVLLRARVAEPGEPWSSPAGAVRLGFGLSRSPAASCSPVAGLLEARSCSG